MVSSRIKSKPNARTENRTTKSAIVQNPDNLIRVKTTFVYSQIARMGRDPRKQAQRAILINTLEEASINISVNGKIVKKDPPFVVMTAQEVANYFGHQVKKTPDASFFQLSNAL